MKLREKLSGLFGGKSKKTAPAKAPPHYTKGVDFLKKLTGHAWERIDDIAGGTYYVYNYSGTALQKHGPPDTKAVAAAMNETLSKAVTAAGGKEETVRDFFLPEPDSRGLYIRAGNLGKLMKFTPDNGGEEHLLAVSGSLKQLIADAPENFKQTRRKNTAEILSPSRKK